MLDYKLTNFDNGLKLLTSPLEHTKAVTVLFLVGVGSRYETPKQNGLSHFLEHMFFKGTKKRPTTLDISKALDAVGASYNAFTGEEYTCFYVRSASEHFDLALDILFDFLYNSKFDQVEIDKEKGVISEEINMYQDTPQSYVVELAKKLFYPDQPLGMPVAGEKETISKFSRQDFVNYRDSFYTPNNIIVSIAGGSSSGSGYWEKRVKEYFAKIGLKKEGDYLPVKENQSQPQVLVHYKATDQAHLILGFRTFPRINEINRPILRVLNNVFGETMSSRLFTEVREKRGLAYYVGSEMADFQDAGALAVSAGLDIKRIDEAIKVILAEFHKVIEQELTDEEFSRAKENLKGRLYLGLEESFDVAEFLAEQELFWGKIDDPDTLIKKWENVTKKEMQELARKYFVKENLNLAVIGPFKDENKFKNILEKF